MKPNKPRRGRPVKDPAERRSAELRIRLTADERAILDAWARAYGEETSTRARAVLLRAARAHAAEAKREKK